MEKRITGKVESHSSLKWMISGDPDMVIALKRIFPRADASRAGVILLQKTQEVAKDILWFDQRYPLEISERKFLEKEALAHETQLVRLERIFIDGPKENFDLALPPRDYQKIAAEITLQQGYLLLADELGLGKTVSSICVLSRKEARPAIVITPAHLCLQWKSFLAKFLPAVEVEIAKTSKPHTLKPKTEILILSYAKLTGWKNHLAENPPKTIVFDEIQELRRPESQKYQAAASLREKIPIALGNSGTPITNYGGEIFHILRILCPDRLGNEAEFKREWCSYTGSSAKWIVRDPEALGSYLRRERLILRRTKKDVGRELPPLITTVHTVPFNPEIIHEAESAAVELAKILLTGSFTQRGEAAREMDLRLRQATGIAKAQYVAEFCKMFLEEKTPLILFGWHRACHELWRETLQAHNPVYYTGEESAKEKQRSAEAFIEGETDLLILSLRSGLGLDGIQKRCSTVVFGELDWSRSFHEQCVGRALRDGQKETVSAIYLVADGGSDPIVSQILGIKAAQASGIIDPFLKPAPATSPEEEVHRLKTLAQHILKKHGHTI